MRLPAPDRSNMAGNTPEPVGPEYGLQPTRDTKLIQPPFTSESIVSTDDYRTGSEYGGVAGLVQPTPHVMTAAERRRQIMFIDPTDPGDDPSRGSVVAPDLEGDFT